MSLPAMETTSTNDIQMEMASSDALSPTLPGVILCPSESSEESMSDDDREWKEVSDSGDWEQNTSRKRKGNPRNDLNCQGLMDCHKLF